MGENAPSPSPHTIILGHWREGIDKKVCAITTLRSRAGANSDAGFTIRVANYPPRVVESARLDGPLIAETSDVLRTAFEFHAKGGKLVQLEFPYTEVQHFGDVAIVWSSYVLETQVDGKRSSNSGRVTEIFVWQQGRWTNPGWHTDPEK